MEYKLKLLRSLLKDFDYTAIFSDDIDLRSKWAEKEEEIRRLIRVCRDERGDKRVDHQINNHKSEFGTKF